MACGPNTLWLNQLQESAAIVIAPSAGSEGARERGAVRPKRLDQSFTATQVNEAAFSVLQAVWAWR